MTLPSLAKRGGFVGCAGSYRHDMEVPGNQERLKEIGRGNEVARVHRKRKCQVRSCSQATTSL